MLSATCRRRRSPAASTQRSRRAHRAHLVQATRPPRHLLRQTFPLRALLSRRRTPNATRKTAPCAMRCSRRRRKQPAQDHHAPSRCSPFVVSISHRVRPSCALRRIIYKSNRYLGAWDPKRRLQMPQKKLPLKQNQQPRNLKLQLKMKMAGEKKGVLLKMEKNTTTMKDKSPVQK